MKLRVRSSPVPAAPPAALASIASLASLFLVLALVRETDRTAVALPGSDARTEAGRGAACVVLARSHAAPGARDSAIFAFTDGDGPSLPLGGVTDVFLAALRVVAGDPDRPFAVKADRGIRYALVDDVIEQLRKAGVREVTLLTRAAPAEEAP